MSGFTGIRSVTLIIAACLVFVLLKQGTFSSSPLADGGISPSVNMASDPVPKLDVSLRQTGTNPPTLTVKVANNNEGPVTILTWDSPLDHAALQLGLIEITPEGASAPLELQTVQFRRVTPPGPESLVEIAAGESVESEVILKQPTVSEDEIFAGKDTATVVMRGTWMAVWGSARKEISDDEIDRREKSFGGSFQSNGLKIQREM
ncbi:uncharacterized protein PpBr36_09996 [Pyricularia pennisetigena]|uniref:uncharacterized protein n=1 Tax=Pyricularia pennisetigena TaxID=1578925 RepID=UPI0011536182|nr:uncharacterized protein PpBr36_09996 [Pyricularia pennisetigena]TLS22428.1 hypothetical protein PpBr36_09996 [Pyricularia pennisetigena]